MAVGLEEERQAAKAAEAEGGGVSPLYQSPHHKLRTVLAQVGSSNLIVLIFPNITLTVRQIGRGARGRKAIMGVCGWPFQEIIILSVSIVTSYMNLLLAWSLEVHRVTFYV